MSEKSYVSMERHVCPICLKQFDTGAILLDRTLRKTMERYSVTDYSLCEECETFNKQGYIALIELDPAQPDTARVKLENAHRTGRVCRLKRHVFKRIFRDNQKDADLPFIFTDAAVCNALVAIDQRIGK